MRTSLSILLVTTTLLVLTFVESQHARHLSSQVEQSTGRVRGAVLDPHEARIVNATVTIEGASFERVTKTNDLGEYEFEVPSGVYRIKAEAPNYYGFQRAAFRVDGNTVKTINIVPTQRLLSIGLEVTAQGTREPVTTAPPPRFETFPGPSGPTLDVLIQFQNRQPDGDFIDYSAATLSYDFLTIYGEKLRFNKRGLAVEAWGKVVVEDGKQRVYVTRARASLRERDINVTFGF